MTNSSVMQYDIYSKQIARSDLENFLQSDASIFPSRLTLQTLESWYDTNPMYFLSYHIDKESTNNSLPEISLGTILALPMKATFWQKLITGEIEEHEITADMILQQNCLSKNVQDEYGIHIWHIEKFKLWDKFCSTRFRDRFWSDLQHAVCVFDSQTMKCIGFSALCATDEGARAMEKLKFGHEGSFDFIVQNGRGERKVVHLNNFNSETDKDGDEWKTIFECRIYVKRVESTDLCMLHQ